MPERRVPSEYRKDEVFKPNKEKYSYLCSMCEEKGWSIWLFPVEIGCGGFVGKSTRQRLDLLIYLTSTKCIMLELRVPWESRIDETFETNKEKYSYLCSVCKEKGWSTWLFPVEIRCRGFVGKSTI